MTFLSAVLLGETVVGVAGDGEEEERTPEGGGQGILRLRSFPEAALFLSVIALPSLWHWLSNSNGSTTGWL